MDKFKPFKMKIEPDKVVISIRIEEDTLENVDKLARYGNISRNELINQCIRYALDNIENNGCMEKKKDSKKFLSNVS